MRSPLTGSAERQPQFLTDHGVQLHRKGKLKMTAPAPQAAAPLSEAEDKQWASFAHLGGIIGILPSLIIWLIFKDRGAKTNVEGKEALNFQITVAIAAV